MIANKRQLSTLPAFQARRTLTELPHQSLAMPASLAKASPPSSADTVSSNFHNSFAPISSSFSMPGEVDFAEVKEGPLTVKAKPATSRKQGRNVKRQGACQQGLLDTSEDLEAVETHWERQRRLTLAQQHALRDEQNRELIQSDPALREAILLSVANAHAPFRSSSPSASSTTASSPLLLSPRSSVASPFTLASFRSTSPPSHEKLTTTLSPEDTALDSDIHVDDLPTDLSYPVQFRAEKSTKTGSKGKGNRGGATLQSNMAEPLLDGYDVVFKKHEADDWELV